MTTCIDTDTLIELENALAWRAADAVEHVSRCAACADRMSDLETLHQSALTVDLDAAFHASVMASIAAEAVAEARGPATRRSTQSAARLMSPGSGYVLAVFALATICAWLLLAASWMTSHANAALPEAPTVAIALIAGGIAAWSLFRAEKRVIRTAG